MLKTATVICAKCSRNGSLFGIRTEKRQKDWYFTWSFRMTDEMASHEGYDKTIINNGIETDKSYPGCPYCKSKQFIQCSCGKIMCYDGESKYIKCHFCGESGNVISSNWSAVTGGGF